MTVRVKVCGITRPADARLAAKLGVDFVGLNFWPHSPRWVSVARAQEIAHALPAQVAKVGVFVNAVADDVRALADTVGLEYVQFHGDETVAYVARFGARAIKALGVKDAQDARRVADYASCAFVLVDTASVGYGGSGQTFDWSALSEVPRARLWLAGGLTAENVAEAIARVGPYAVDTASGVESAPGEKDAEKMRAFVAAVRGARFAEPSGEDP